MTNHVFQGTDYLVKEVSTGDSIHSLLSILDFITVCPSSGEIHTIIMSKLIFKVFFSVENYVYFFNMLLLSKDHTGQSVQF